jgi:hypothetical protein
MGWERPNWFAGLGKTPDMQYGCSRGAYSIQSPPSTAPRAKP